MADLGTDAIVVGWELSGGEPRVVLTVQSAEGDETFSFVLPAARVIAGQILATADVLEDAYGEDR